MCDDITEERSVVIKDIDGGFGRYEGGCDGYF